MADKQIPDHLLNFEEMSERDPMGFLARFDELISSGISEAETRRMEFLHARTLFRISRHADARNLCLEGIKEAASHNDYDAIIEYYQLLAKCFLYTNEVHRIKACYEIAIDYSRQSSQPDLIVSVYLNYGKYLTRQQLFEAASKYLDLAWKTVQKSPNLALKVEVLLGIVDVHYYQHSYKKALSYNLKAYEITLEAGILPMQINILDRSATLYSLTNKGDMAIQALDKALALCQQVPSMYFKIIYNKGTLLLRQKNPAAKDCFEAVEQHISSKGYPSPSFQCELYNNLAGSYFLCQDLEKSSKYSSMAMEIADAIDNPDFKMLTKLNQTHLMFLLGEYKQAKRIIDEAIAHYTSTKNSSLLLTALQLKQYMYEQQQLFAEALKASKQIEQHYKGMVNELRAEIAADSEAKMNTLNQKYESGLLGCNTSARKAKTKSGCMFIGSSSASLKVLDAALLAAQHPNANVFITGESGTGKDVLANIIHQHSIRKDAPFVAINIAALSPGILESELFGHVRGAFTGAISNTHGFLHKANNGTLFLDEITEMPSDTQSKLLRVVENHIYTPVGGRVESSFDSRIISATNRDIQYLIRDSAFRLDLFHRLNTIEIYIPPLRERKDDIEELLMHYTELYSQQNKQRIPKISNDFVKVLLRYSFPGNVRELKNLVERLYILCGDDHWTFGHLMDMGIAQRIETENTMGWGHPEAEKIISALKQTQGKQKEAAKILGLSESTLCRRIVKYNLEAYTFKHRES